MTRLDGTRDAFGSLGRRSYLQAAGAATLGTAGFAGCVGQASGTLATNVTDQPADIGDFESLVVTIEGVWLGPEGAESGADDQSVADDEESDDDADSEEDADADEDAPDETADDGAEDDDTGADGDDGPSGREYHAFDEPQEADLVQLQGDEVQLIDERELDVATYRFLQLDVTDTDATLADGGEATVELPGQAPITFNAEFEIREDTRTSFTADFAPVRRGRTGTYVLRPVPRGIEVSYEENEEMSE
ncbi:DUF4382 domain-containing protein [Halorubrum sp. DTA98]|uniref:DUF4382 domain-containing protein n=1 Tax=Halorubrum sp. DTA98 TaxID=3402163 RepID=UPI003AACF6B2